MAENKQTALYQWHVKAKARMVPFAGFSMPIQYSGIKVEHQAVRDAAGLFDVGHMGNVFVSGPGAAEYLNRMVPGNVLNIKPMRALYSMFCLENGGIIDDIIIYRLQEQEFLVIVNAANIEKDVEWMQKHIPENASLQNKSEDFGIIALQGPKAGLIMKKLGLEEEKYSSFDAGYLNFSSKEILFGRTGYTGEDGFEIFPPNDDVQKLWSAIMEAGEEFGINPCGLAARDVLRLEAGLPLYGQDLTENTNPVEAGLSWVIDFEKEDFIGRKALIDTKENKPRRRLTGIVLEGKGIPRAGYIVLKGDREIGITTSGTFSPSLAKGIAFAYIDRELAKPGNEVEVAIRNQKQPAKTHRRRFYSP